MLVAPIVLASCGQLTGTARVPSSASPTPIPTESPLNSPSAAPRVSPSAAAYGVLVDLSSAGEYDVSVVGVNGTVAASAHAVRRSRVSTETIDIGTEAMEFPYISATGSRLYYLDGDSTVRWLTPGGSKGVATALPGGRAARAAFAVSPDDARIAVAVFDYAPRPPIVHLSVGPLTGPLTEIYASASNYVWPVGWHAGKLVLAAQGRPPFAQQGILFNPYGARSYHVVDPASAERVAIVGNPEDVSGCWPTGLLTVAGTACYLSTAFGGRSGGYSILNWTGTRYLPAARASWSSAAAVAPAPSTSSVVVCCEGNGDSGRFQLSGGGPNPATVPLSGSKSDWACWIDQTHVLSGFINAPQPRQSAVLDLTNQQVVPAAARGFCAAVLPTDLG